MIQNFPLSMKYLAPAFLALTLVVPFVASADVMPDGKHSVIYCLSIDNVADYPDSNFYAVGGARFAEVSKVLSATPECSDTFDYMFIVDKADERKLNTTATRDGEPFAWDRNAGNAEYIPQPVADLPEMPTYVSDADATTKVEYVLHLIDSCEACTHPNYTVERITNYDKAGKVLGVVDAGSAETGLDSDTIAAGIAVGAGILILIVAAKSWKK